MQKPTSYPSGKPQSPAQFPHLSQVSDPKHPFSKREARFMASVCSNDSPNPFPGLLSNHTLGKSNTQDISRLLVTESK